jgi:hypothetical protein
MNYFNFVLYPLVLPVNGIELLAQIKAIDPLAEVGIARNVAGEAVEILVSTSGTTQRAQFETAILSHVPTKTEVQHAAELEENAFRDRLKLRLEDPSFLSFVEDEVSIVKGTPK